MAACFGIDGFYGAFTLGQPLSIYVHLIHCGHLRVSIQNECPWVVRGFWTGGFLLGRAFPEVGGDGNAFTVLPGRTLSKVASVPFANGTACF